jgi:hypothetical protein
LIGLVALSDPLKPIQTFEVFENLEGR